jgi:hypothetical protein
MEKRDGKRTPISVIKQGIQKDTDECWLYLWSNIANYHKAQFLTIEIPIKFMKQPRLLQHKLFREYIKIWIDHQLFQC